MGGMDLLRGVAGRRGRGIEVMDRLGLGCWTSVDDSESQGLAIRSGPLPDHCVGSQG